MSLVPEPSRPDLSASWSRFRVVTKRLAATEFAAGEAPGGAPSSTEDLALFGEFLLARDALFARLALPVTAHNSLRLYDFALAGASLERFLEDVDAPLPRALLTDEGLFLSALATYCGWRGVREFDARVYDAEAFLGVPHHPHNAAVLAAWLRGDLDWLTARTHLARDEEALDFALA